MSANRMNSTTETKQRFGGRVARLAATLALVTTMGSATAIASTAGTGGAITVGTPSAPTAVTAAKGTVYGTYIVHWTAPASNGGSAITGYVITPYFSGFAYPAVRFNTTATTRTTPWLPQSFVCPTRYRFTVAAVNARGTGPKSVVSNIVTSGPAYCRY